MASVFVVLTWCVGLPVDRMGIVRVHSDRFRRIAVLNL
jgi:hypothetical protein